MWVGANVGIAVMPQSLVFIAHPLLLYQASCLRSRFAFDSHLTFCVAELADVLAAAAARVLAQHRAEP
jgi:hypothetical protein